jgi:hypothetical protein
VALRHYFLSVIRFPPASIIPTVLRAYPDLCVAVTGETIGGRLKTFEKNRALSEIGEHSIAKYFDLIFKGLNSFYYFYAHIFLT